MTLLLLPLRRFMTLLCCCPLLALAQDQPLTLVVDNYPPYIDELAEPQGVLTQLVQQSFHSSGVQTTLQFLPWQKVPLAAEKANTASFLWFKTNELEQDWLFSDVLVEVKQQLIGRTEQNFNPKRWDELRPYRLGVTANYFYGVEFDQIKAELTLETAVSDYANLQNLLAGKVDYVLMDPVVAHQLLLQMPSSTAKVRYLSKPVLTAQSAYLVCSRNYLPCIDIIRKFNLGLKKQRKAGLDQKLFGIGVATSR
ncbi:ABC transporter substrate-binding protein [Rheinheimera sp.]|uniref:substrate-binding periplasmic protein n=1 Tax=Rheinheimera sp. TaxID=1869214 RepID=UPI0027B8C92C|nr:transporter substrate-binding domain-containing protein [Rheinheimera sp.]